MRCLPPILLLLLCATSVGAEPAKPVKASNGQSVLQASDGRSLYVSDDDGPGTSHCDGECGKLWPPFLLSTDDKPADDWTALARADGSRQWMYKGRPLYLFARDSKPGETNGNQFNGNKWHVAKP